MGVFITGATGFIGVTKKLIGVAEHQILGLAGSNETAHVLREMIDSSQPESRNSKGHAGTN
jgi:nucleoside-diphosphate-sugar epimerase